MGNSTQAMDFANPGANYLQGKNQAPPAPDYIGAANATSAGSIGAALANNLMSHPNVSTPLGSQTWNQTGSSSINIPGLGAIDIPQYSQTVNLSPDQQQLYNKQTQLANTTQDQAQANLSQPQDLNSAQAIADKAYGNYTSRLDPQWAANKEASDAQLANQGITQGSEAYNNAQRTFNNAKNDAYTQANTASINTMPQTYQLATAARDQPLNEMNALKTGSQVNMPQFQATSYPGQAQGPNATAATQGQAAYQTALYNSQIAQQNATTQGAFGLGSAALAAFA